MKLDALIDWYHTMTPETVRNLRQFYADDARFRDPFNDVRGHRAIAAVFDHMFETTLQPCFSIRERQQGGRLAWIRWVFSCRLQGRALSVEGATRLEFGADGRVIDHRDYWDSAEVFQQLPVLGRIVRHAKNRLTAPPPRMTQRRTEP